MKPKVSIIIPVYNGEKYIKEAIDSALNQDYNNIEVIVINDGSKDNTEEICLLYKDRIRYYKKENGGVSSALNLGIKKMNGDYFSWLSHDDYYLPNKVSIQINFLNEIGKKDVILYSDYKCINSKGKDFKYPVVMNHEMLEKKPLYAILRGCINGITMLIPKIAFDKCGEFDESLRCTQDYDMWWRMIKKYQFIHMQDIITKTRIHNNQDTRKNPNALKEGNILWKRLIEDITDEEKIKYEGCIYNYYYEMAKFLSSTPYNETKAYCINKCLKMDREKYAVNPIKKNKRGILKVFSYIQDHGFIYTAKKIISKLFN